MQLVLRAAGIISIIVSVIWWIVEPGFDPLYAFITGLVALLSSFIIPQQETKGESLDERNRRIMLNHVENFWVKGVLEKSLHGAALLELGIKEDPSAVRYPWKIKKETTNETLHPSKSMLEIFNEIGMGRALLILGAPGSGKTTMMLELTRQLIERAREDYTEPIPVVFNLASWKENQTLADWLAEQLNVVYYVPKKIAPSWLKENRMLLLLDDLDELKQDRRAKCVEAINNFRKEHGLTSLTVCSRIQEYGNINRKLSLEGAITLQPITFKQINAYFDRFGKSLAPVKQLLRKDKALQELAETPLMLSIMTLAYKDRKANELIAFGNLEEQRQHLLNTYISGMLHRVSRKTHFSDRETLHYLSWLAHKMIHNDVITFQIEAMQPFWLEKQSQLRLYQMFVGMIFGLILGPMAGLSSNLIIGLIVGPILGLSFWFIGGRLSGKIDMVDKLTWSWNKARTAVISALIVGMIIGLSRGLFIGLLAGGLLGLILGITSGLKGEQIEETTRPGQRLRQTLFNAVFVFTLIWIIMGLMISLNDRPRNELSLSSIELLGVTLSAGLIGALPFGVRALIQHYSLRLVLALNDFLPPRPIPFLDYCVDLIFLRRVGGSYIFVHRLLMEHFAEMDA